MAIKVGGLKGILDSVLDRRVTVERQTTTAGAAGGTQRAPWKVMLRDVPCLIVQSPSRVSTQYAKREIVVDYQVVCTADLGSLVPDGGLALTDRLRDEKGMVYLVQGMNKTAHSLLPVMAFIVDVTSTKAGPAA